MNNAIKNDKNPINPLRGLLCSPYEDTGNNFLYEEHSSEQGSIKGKYNTYIIFGRDRPASTGEDLLKSIPRNTSAENIKKQLYSGLVGYGPKGFNKCGTIDIVAGRYSASDSEDPSLKELDNLTKKTVNPNFFEDASRIYISQRTDIDENFKLCEGAYGKSYNQCAIGIKSDAIRIIGRESVKIFTGIDEFLGSPSDRPGKKIANHKRQGVELICGNRLDGKNNDMQPIPKGENLIAALRELAAMVFSLEGILISFAKIQSDFNDALGTHTHIEKFQGHNTSFSLDVLPESKKSSFNIFTKVFGQGKFFANNLKVFENTFFDKGSQTYICSKYHKLN